MSSSDSFKITKTAQKIMNAVLITVKGNLKPMALRHHVFKLGTTLGICGFLNYRNGMNELLIHAEGKTPAMAEFTKQISQLSIEYKLGCSMEPISLGDFVDFKISELDHISHRKAEHANNRISILTLNNPFSK